MDQPDDRLISENPFLAQLRANDAILLKRLYSDSFGSLREYVVRNSGSADDALDVYQEAFLATWRNVQLSRFLPDDAQAFSAYLLQVGKKKWIDELRKRKISLAIIRDRAENDDSEVYDIEVDAYIQAVRKHYASLGERCRELLTRFYYRKQRLRDIALHFGWTEASAKNNKYRCLQELRSHFLKR